MASQEQSQGYVFDLESNLQPVAIITPDDTDTVVNAVVKLDGRASKDPEGSGLTYKWSFTDSPIGSNVLQIGFVNLEGDASVITFVPDLSGHYQVQLIVNDGSLDSEPALAEIDVFLVLTPLGIIPDASFIWNYLSDFWNKVDDRKCFEIIWSAWIQVVGAELLKLYQYDYNKSIKDIQELIHKRWISYNTALDLDSTKTKFILADDQAGVLAITALITPNTGLPAEDQPTFSNLVSVPLSEGNFETAKFNSPITKRVLRLANRNFTLFRAGKITRAANSGSDGKTSASSSTFTGSGFTASQLGSILRVLTGDDAGDYTIDSIISTTQVTVDSDFTDDATLLKYTVLAKGPTDSVCFTDASLVPTRLFKQPWRFSSTLISSEFDFEAKGVSKGDVIVVSVNKVDTSISLLFNVQVVSVDRNKLGFTFSTDSLSDGTPAGGLSNDTQIQLAEAFQVGGLIRQINGDLLYSGDAAQIRSTINSFNFKRKYFEKELTGDDEIDLDLFSVTLKAVKIIRNTSVPIDTSIKSITILQEFINPPDTIETGGKVFRVLSDGLEEIDRAPTRLVENKDYIVDDETTINGQCNVTSSIDIIVTPFGDLIERDIREGDSITVNYKGNLFDFTILRILDSETLKVTPIPVITGNNLPFKITRRVGGKFIRFIGDTFTPSNLAPERLWAELTYFSNDSNVEANFGILVDLSEKEHERQEVKISYKNAVAGLMKALVEGPVIADIELAAHILAGLPFATHAGVIKDIDPLYRPLSNGAPSIGRITIEARDKDDQPLGLTDVYLYPQGRQRQLLSGDFEPASPDLSGLAINPDTGEEYKIGDEVIQFATLSKGARVTEYLISPSSFALIDIQKYHSFKLLINADVTGTSDIDLATRVVAKIKPHYTRIISGLRKDLDDDIDVEDSIVFSYFIPPIFFDTPAFSLPMAAKFDRNIEGISEDAFIDFEGHIFSRYLFGVERDDIIYRDDLITIQGSNTVESPTGGFIIPNVALEESHDSPYIRSGDVLHIKEGVNKGRYTITSVTDNTHVVLDFDGEFQTLSEQSFTVYRPVQNPILTSSMEDIGPVSIINGDSNITMPDGSAVAGMAIGDILILSNSTTSVSKKYVITSFSDLPVETNEEANDANLNKITIFPAPSEVSGSYSFMVIREGIVTKYLLAAENDTPYKADFISGNPLVVFDGSMSDVLQLGMIRPGDTIKQLDEDIFTILEFNPSNLTAFVTPTPSETALDQLVKIWRQENPTTVISTNLDKFPVDTIRLEFKSSTKDLTTTSGSDTVSTVSGLDFIDLGVLPGDYLVIREGADSIVDVGHGVGIYLIASLPTSTTLKLSHTLTSTEGAPGLLFSILRTKPNEG